VIVFNDGSIYCCFHSLFQNRFQKVADRWSKAKRDAGEFHHAHDFPKHFLPSDQLGDDGDLPHYENELSTQAQQGTHIHQTVSAPEASNQPIMEWTVESRNPHEPAPMLDHNLAAAAASYNFIPRPAVPSTVQPNSSVSNQTAADEYSQLAAPRRRSASKEHQVAAGASSQRRNSYDRVGERCIELMRGVGILPRSSPDERNQKSSKR
jgi:hypothetical protein